MFSLFVYHRDGRTYINATKLQIADIFDALIDHIQSLELQVSSYAAENPSPYDVKTEAEILSEITDEKSAVADHIEKSTVADHKKSAVTDHIEKSAVADHTESDNDNDNGLPFGDDQYFELKSFGDVGDLEELTIVCYFFVLFFLI